MKIMIVSSGAYLTGIYKNSHELMINRNVLEIANPLRQLVISSLNDIVSISIEIHVTDCLKMNLDRKWIFNNVALTILVLTWGPFH